MRPNEHINAGSLQTTWLQMSEKILVSNQHENKKAKYFILGVPHSRNVRNIYSKKLNTFPFFAHD